MYEYINGKLTLITPSYVVVETFGIGYKLSVANPYRYSNLKNAEVKIFLYQVIREDAHTLYGFYDEAEKELFTRLISVSGIGPKSALAILASEDHLGLVSAIQAADVTYLTKFPGVGKKTAQQMILDLQDKLGEFAGEELMSVAREQNENEELSEALEALKALGYPEKDVKKVKKALDQEKLTTDAYLRQALKLLTQK
ncbi:Holliday junction DNA helicase subunit RuvA [Pilibacter termitis]|uniref:Holliday junction branch migration complex subunit RuvA n=1 Tax=Pilibacter termitis TaxID=263852 RepID=A0A1T4QUV1_9ENTE|nr:Holliday junction branch migration protein RuvA [Pilibacter termitis]SKA07475.1 Holliday junction DNA helicase subunit RuvA [Pilibacter termitis]